MHIDQIGHEVDMNGVPQRIISLVPSQTELLHDLGLEKEVIGITKFCVHPEEWFRNKTRIGGTKKLDIEKIKSLKPNLIIANKEENTQEHIEELSRYFPVWTSNIIKLDDALSMIDTIGRITNKINPAEIIISKIKEGFLSLQSSIANHQFTSCYLIWREPYMSAGGDTFINDMMNRAGFVNIFQHKVRYPETTIEELIQSDCEVIMLSSEPFPFKQKHVDELQVLVPNKKVILVNGEYFSWYGSRLLGAPEYFKHLQAASF